MENIEFFFAGIILALLLAFFVSLKLDKWPVTKRTIIGGCSGTRYGCCRNSKKACRNRKCSNC
tara:strand:- start:685 stop:873 length:189 start_codon:yes stop_codon:yes gene_type:complete